MRHYDIWVFVFQKFYFTIILDLYNNVLFVLSRFVSKWRSATAGQSIKTTYGSLLMYS